MEQINIPKIEQTIKEITEYIGENERLNLLFTSQPKITIDVYRKTSLFIAEKEYEEHERKQSTIPHGFYQILENEMAQYGALKTLKKYEREIQTIANIVNMPVNELKKIILNVRHDQNKPQLSQGVLAARNTLKEIIRKATAKYKESFIKRIIDEKLELLKKYTFSKEKTKNTYQLPVHNFIESITTNPILSETLSSYIAQKIGIIPSSNQIEETILASFEENYVDLLKRIYKIETPSCFNAFIKNKAYIRLKQYYEPKLNKFFKNSNDKEKERIIEVLKAKTKLKELSQKDNLEYQRTKKRLKSIIPHDFQITLEEISTLLIEANCELVLKNGQLFFDIQSKVSKEEIKECKEYIKKEKALKNIHDFIFRYYINQNQLINSLVKQSPTPLSAIEENYYINTDYWFSKEKIIKAIDAIDKEKIERMSKKDFNLLKKFLLEDGLLWAYIANNIDLTTFAKIINNFESIIACSSIEEITIENLKNIIKKANLYDYANDLIIGLLGADITAKIINYNQFSGVNVSDEIIYSRLRKAVDLSVRSEKINTSSLPFNCDVKKNNYKLSRYMNNDPAIFTSGIDTKTCFFISVNENDFFFYSLLNKNGYVIKITDKDNHLVARATCFRKNNVLMINGIRCKNNKVIASSQEETNEMIEIVELVKLMAQKMIELTSQDECPIDFVVCNKAGILENDDIDNAFRFENVNPDFFREPINIYEQDWEEFVHTYDGKEQLLQEVPYTPNKSFTTDFGNHYPAILVASRNNMGFLSVRDISLKDQPPTYKRPRKPIEEYISAEINQEILAKINRIKALYCFIGEPNIQQEKQKNFKLIKSKSEIKNVVIGDDWCIILTSDDRYELYFTRFTIEGKKEILKYITRLSKNIRVDNIQEVVNESLLPIVREDIKEYLKQIQQIHQIKKA